MLQKKICHIFGLFVFLLTACNFAKVSNVRIKNENNYPIDVSIIANNVQYQTKSISPNSTHTGTLDFTNMEKRNGEYTIIIHHTNTQTTDTFTHGAIYDGNLANYTDLEIKDHQLKVAISD